MIAWVADNLALDYNQVMTWDLLGHEWAVELLQKQIKNNDIRHAYLFTGPPGVGRRTCALQLAQAINCASPTLPGVPCQNCSTCKRIAQSQHPDLSIIQADRQGGTLKVDQIRELQHILALTPYESRYRIALLLRFEEAHVSASNALLKTLEEPASKVVLFLTANSPESLLPTIVSRCEVLRLRTLPLDVLSQGLQERWHVPADQASLLAHLSGGRPGYALRLFEQPEWLEKRKAWLTDLLNILKGNRVERFAYVKTLIDLQAKKKDQTLTPELLRVWLSFWRDVLLRAAQTDIAPSNLDWENQVEEVASCLEVDKIVFIIQSIERTLKLLEQNINIRLVLETLMLDLPRSRIT
jgi:DNA polymerase-3 subunit delta'